MKFQVNSNCNESLSEVLPCHLSDVPRLPSLPGNESMREEEEEGGEEEDNLPEKPAKVRRPSGPKTQDPYAADDTSSMLLPVLVVLGAFLPTLFFLCRL